MNNGRILKKKRPFTQVSNSALRDPNLSLKAKGLYALINSYIDIPDFTLYKPFLIQQCQEGKAAFQTAWDELKKAGYLIQRQVRNGNRFNYEYELLDEPEKNSQHTDFRNTENEDAQIQDTQNQDDINNIESKNTDEKNIKDLLLLMNISENAAILRLPERYKCSFEMLYYALGIAYKAKPKNPVGYLSSIFSAWNQDNNRTLADLGVSLCTKEESNCALTLYQEEIKNEQAEDLSQQFCLLSKMFTYKELKGLMRSNVISGNGINSMLR